jgi:hypothetical protein
MNYVVEMRLGTRIYIPSLIKIGSGIQKLIGGIHIQTQTHTQGQEGDLISLLLFFQNKGSSPKIPYIISEPCIR